MSRTQYHLGLSAGFCAALGVGAAIATSGCPQTSPIAGPPAGAPQLPLVRVLVGAGDEMTLATLGGYRILIDHRVAVSSLDALPEGKLIFSGGAWAIHAARYPGRTLAIEGIGQSFVRLNGTAYRGRIVFTPDAASGILAVNHVDVESYLAGVLRRELLPHWHLETYKAQAVAARTYALYEKATVGADRLYDLRDDQSSQVYGGFSAETDKSWQAVAQTHGIVLTSGTPGQERIFRAHYSSCCGGKSNNVHVLYGPLVEDGVLAGGVVCTDCSPASRFRWPPLLIDKELIHKAVGAAYPAVAAMPGVRTVETVKRIGDRPTWVDIVGRDGSKVRIRAEDLRLALIRSGDPTARKLYSMNCDIRDSGATITFGNGRGFGHGVGLCQWGAQTKAEQGFTAAEILQAYYPGAKLFRAY